MVTFCKSAMLAARRLPTNFPPLLQHSHVPVEQLEGLEDYAGEEMVRDRISVQEEASKAPPRTRHHDHAPAPLESQEEADAHWRQRWEEQERA